MAQHQHHQQQQQSEIAEPTAIGDRTDIVWINRQHGQACPRF